MNTLIAGTSGFIGRSVTAIFQDNGSPIRRIVRDPKQLGFQFEATDLDEALKRAPQKLADCFAITSSNGRAPLRGSLRG